MIFQLSRQKQNTGFSKNITHMGICSISNIHQYSIFHLLQDYNHIQSTPVNRWNSWKRGNDVESIIEHTFWNNSRHFFLDTWCHWLKALAFPGFPSPAGREVRTQMAKKSSSDPTSSLINSFVLLINMVKTTIFHCSLLMKLVANSSSFMMTSSFSIVQSQFSSKILLLNLAQLPFLTPFSLGELGLFWPRLASLHASHASRRGAAGAAEGPRDGQRGIVRAAALADAAGQMSLHHGLMFFFFRHGFIAWIFAMDFICHDLYDVFLMGFV